jgi:hypothetical protein
MIVPELRNIADDKTRNMLSLKEMNHCVGMFQDPPCLRQWRNSTMIIMTDMAKKAWSVVKARLCRCGSRHVARQMLCVRLHLR